ncbi:hypothetical protein jhhlp_001103 [Lomentospora prolificans]|uniref:BHLH domain-containing protein n=1 Tax=Lomentospora prolificans TaxID=41688 RepID=A0A2N3NH99_9PEZI|nr:hypothetical protein jhhlp_001103 [Lomentospora prolificans]
MATVNETPRPPAHGLPAGLKDIVNDENRDSAYFSSDASSKHTSAASFGHNNMLSPLGSGYQSSPTDKTPSPTSASLLPQPLVSPSGSSMSLAAVVSPTTNTGAARPGEPRRYDLPYIDGDPASRRESVDSRINQGFNDMRIGNPAYAAHNQSNTSIQTTLSTQRNPRPGLENLSVHRISNGYQPSAERNPEAIPKAARTAPAITGPATSTIARAAEPTKGQAWAFPEDDVPRLGANANGAQYQDSRRSSIADSLASSQFTTESRLPPGQRRLDEPADYNNRLSSTSGEFPPVHHHTLQQRHSTEQHPEDGRSHAGSQPYSRTPESRQSHKLAERKRRTEMKELFDQLRDLMPQERGSKASKWEILTKAISEHQRQHEHIRALQSHCNSYLAEAEALRKEVQSLRSENSQMRLQLSKGGPPYSTPVPVPPPTAVNTQPPPGPYTATDPFAGPPRTELPPLRSLGAPLPPGPDSMTGVQYETSRPPSFRSERF